MITYVKGDATQPIGSGPKFIVHCCNDQGAWGAGFTKALSDKWDEPKLAYSDAYSSGAVALGKCQVVPINDEIAVINVIGQHRYGTKTSKHYPFIRYDAVSAAFKAIAGIVAGNGGSIHMPRFGCGLAGGEWEKIEAIITDVFVNHEPSIDVYVYDI